MSSKSAAGAPSSGGGSSSNPPKVSLQSSKSSSLTGGKASGKAGSTTSKKKVRRKKPAGPGGGSGGSSGSTNAQAVLSAAHAAQSELQSQKALEAARRKDPLWYNASEVLSEISGDAVPVPDLLNEQVGIVETALRVHGLTRADVTPQAFGVLLEQARRYALELIADAQEYAAMGTSNNRGSSSNSNSSNNNNSSTDSNNSASSSTNNIVCSKADLLLAAEFRSDQQSATTHTLAELQKMTVYSHNINKIPLPSLPPQSYSGVLLPPAPHRLTTRTFDICTAAATAQKATLAIPGKPTAKGASAKSKSVPSYGAKKGRQIPIQLQHKESSASATANTNTLIDGPGPMPVDRRGASTTPGGAKRKADAMM